MKIKREELIEALHIVHPAVGVKVLIPAYGGYKFQDGKVIATNGRTTIQKDIGDRLDFSCSVPTKPLSNLLEDLDAEEVSLLREEDKLIVETDRVVGELELILEEEKVEPIRIPKGAEWCEVNEDLVAALKRSEFAVSDDQTTGAICGIKIRADSVHGTDRYRILRCKLKEGSGFKDCVLRKEFARLIVKFAKEFLGILIEGNRAIFQTNSGVTVSSELILGEYPALDDLIPKADERFRIDLPEDLDAIIDKHIRFQQDTDDIDKKIYLKVEDHQCVLMTEDPRVGSLTEVVNLDQSMAKPTEFIFNPMFLKDTLKDYSEFYYFPDTRVMLLKAKDFEYAVKGRKPK